MCGAEKVRHMLMGEQVLKKWKKSKKMTVAFGGILVMSVVIGGCGGRKMPKRALRSAYLFMISMIHLYQK